MYQAEVAAHIGVQRESKCEELQVISVKGKKDMTGAFQSDHVTPLFKSLQALPGSFLAEA